MEKWKEMSWNKSRKRRRRIIKGQEEERGGLDGKWQGTNGNCRRGFNLAAVIFKDGAGQGFILFRILCNDRLMWVIVAVSADYRGFRPLQWSLPAVTPVTLSQGHTGVVLEITSLPPNTSESVSKYYSCILPSLDETLNENKAVQCHS